MKQVFLFLLIAFSCINANAQTIDGIGKLHLDMSFKEVKALFPQSLIKLETNSKIKKVYKINTYTPIKGHTCRDIRLFFYNDTLYAMYITKAPQVLRKSLTLKYGEPEENLLRLANSVLEIINIFQWDSGDFIDGYYREKEDIMESCYEWNKGNPFAQCQFWESLSEDKNGKILSDYIFLVRNKVQSECVKLEEEILEKEGEEKMKEELKGL